MSTDVDSKSEKKRRVLVLRIYLKFNAQVTAWDKI